MKKATGQKIKGYKIGFKLGSNIGYQQGRKDFESEINNVFKFYFKNDNIEITEDCIGNLITYDYRMAAKLREKDFEINQYKQALKNLLKIISKKNEIEEALASLNINMGDLLEEKTDAERKK
jgi:hypothetical protein